MTMQPSSAALITGGASGIGAAVARKLAAKGVAVALVDADAAKLADTAAMLKADGARVLALPFDVTDPDAMALAASRVGQELAPLRYLVASAGITGAGHAMGEMPAGEWRRVLAVNLDGAFNALNAGFPAMMAAGGGAAVLVSSVMGMVGAGRFAHYTASKHAVIGLARAAAIDGAPHAIRVNSVGPGYVDTPMQQGRIDDARHRELAEKHLLKRFAEADEIAALIVWLLSDGASFATGSHYPIDGGYTAI